MQKNTSAIVAILVALLATGCIDAGYVGVGGSTLTTPDVVEPGWYWSPAEDVREEDVSEPDIGEDPYDWCEEDNDCVHLDCLCWQGFCNHRSVCDAKWAEVGSFCNTDNTVDNEFCSQGLCILGRPISTQ